MTPGGPCSTLPPRFHPYSLGNLLLIGLQAPTATRVAGFRTWQGFGRQVRKGERGIAILAPCTYRPKPAGGGPDGQPAPAAEAGGVSPAVEPGRRQVRGFRWAFVFDVARTDGEPLPEVAPVLLTGHAPAGLWVHLAGQVTGHGYSVERGDCSGANGYRPCQPYCAGPGRCRRRPGRPDLGPRARPHRVRACGRPADLCHLPGSLRGRAESVAYIVTAAAGMDASGYTFAYVAHWAGGDLATVRQAAETVTKAARTILRQLDVPAADPADQDRVAGEAACSSWVRSPRGRAGVEDSSMPPAWASFRAAVAEPRTR